MPKKRSLETVLLEFGLEEAITEVVSGMLREFGQTGEGFMMLFDRGSENQWKELMMEWRRAFEMEEKFKEWRQFYGRVLMNRPLERASYGGREDEKLEEVEARQRGETNVQIRIRNFDGETGEDEWFRWKNDFLAACED